MGVRPLVGELTLLLDARLVLRVRREPVIRDREVVVVQLGFLPAAKLLTSFTCYQTKENARHRDDDGRGRI